MSETRDARVLRLLFDPESAAEGAKIHIDELLVDDASVPASDLREAKMCEQQGILAAEKDKDLDKALEWLDKAIGIAPKYASLYNNRAQIHRLRGSLPSALSDLTTAISLATPSSASNAIAPSAARTLASAHTQRAALLRTLLVTSEARQGTVLADASKETLEGALAADLAEGARYGNEIARALNVSMNPVAKLCSAMIQQSFKIEMESALK